MEGREASCAQAQGTYWFLVMRSDLSPQRNDLSIVKGRRIGAAPWVELALRRVLQEGGIDVERDRVEIMPVPGAVGETVNFGVTAADALKAGTIDGFWANGMGAEVAVRQGVGTIVLDVRRGDGPKPCFDYTMAAISTSDRLIERSPETAAAVIRAMVKTQKALKEDFHRATVVGEKLFPPSEAALIAELVRRDLPFYDATISEKSVKGMNAFARDVGILKGHPAYEDVVATQFQSSGRAETTCRAPRSRQHVFPREGRQPPVPDAPRFHRRRPTGNGGEDRRHFLPEHGQRTA